MFCRSCGQQMDDFARICPKCGALSITTQAPPQQFQHPVYQQQPYQQYQQPVYQQQPFYLQQQFTGVDPNWPIKSKVAAGLLALFLGGIGVHKFYMGQVGMGILYLFFCWTFIPSTIAFIEGIIYLTMNDIAFQQKYRVRTQ